MKAIAMSKNRSNIYDVILVQIKKSMEELKFTQADLGEALNLKQSSISSLLNGKSQFTLEQYLIVAGWLGIKPHKLISSAEAEITQTLPMPPEVELVLYKSELHLLAYCAATQDVSADDLTTIDYPKDKIKSALEDLVRVGVLIKKKEKYTQKDPNVVYQPHDPLRSTDCHRRIALSAWKTWERLRKTNAAFKNKTFNFVLLDRFTRTQMKEVETLLWQAYEKTQSFQQVNMSNGYLSDESMPLYNIHLMLTLPLESK